MSDLFDRPPPARAAAGAASAATAETGYTARDIEVLEGLEPVRRRPGMFIGGTDDRALHHLVAELLDNAMDEAVAGHANRIELALDADQTVTVRDNGRGIPIDPHPKFPDRSALEVILTTLHSGGKFGGKVYHTAGGLHGVGVSVVNALAAELVVEVARNKQLHGQTFVRGRPTGPLAVLGAAANRRGTTVSFKPDPEIFGAGVRFRAEILHRMARSKAYLFRGVEIRWSCDAALAQAGKVPEREVFHFPNGLEDFLRATLAERAVLTEEFFAGQAPLADVGAQLEWAIAWPEDEEPFAAWYCNTVPTPLGGTHESGLRTGLLKAFKAHGERLGQAKRMAAVTADDLLGGASIMLSLYLPNPQFQGQTKDRLVSREAAKPVESVIRDRFELWLGANAASGRALLDHVVTRAEERVARRKSKDDVARKTATRKLRLPGKLADCSTEGRAGTEIFLVEGDSAGGSAKQARNRDSQAILPLRGKILNAASASVDKLQANRELADLVTALGCGVGKGCRADDLRYDKVVIMTDADVDGAHIAALLLTFFYREMRPLVDRGHVYLAQPPLYRLAAGGAIAYARDDADRLRLLETKPFKGKTVEVSRFKGLGEMDPKQLRETTMDPKTRRLLRIGVDDVARAGTELRINELMGRKPELRLAFIQENANLVTEALDV
ncbi:DNA topoisomerase IV subunit B [Marinivivus vitaminiproducens]|uniref:DNA topoisomerase IV subunit B n=1 Tax=Marinivivus vitaminiproducens TaxID=3035935 RepID=UPI00279E9E0A|nr:DNA topoisomerase IV subunit B [Geminicoccaceae bacterium SCSIO 64248]